jgi:zinc and cadmium transporter
MNLVLIITFCLLGSVCSVGFAALLLLFKGRRLSLFTSRLIPYAIGTLLGAAFFGMIPHALRRLPSESVLPTVLAGIVLFFLLEKLALWRHCHEHRCDVHTRAGEMILFGDSLHNFVDGVAIAAAFAGSVPLGIATSLAVIAHEVPQEVGDFAILLECGYKRSRALLWNTLSSLATLPGAILAYYLLPFVRWGVPYLLSLSAASFIYIALADLVPGRRNWGGLRGLVQEMVSIGLGVSTIAVLRMSSVK